MLSSIVKEPPSKLDLSMIEEGEGEFAFHWPKIDDDIIGNMPFLGRAVNSPGDVVKILRNMTCSLLEEDTTRE